MLQEYVLPSPLCWIQLGDRGMPQYDKVVSSVNVPVVIYKAGVVITLSICVKFVTLAFLLKIPEQIKTCDY